ncbi:MAG: hypothetical protein ABFD94_14955 [Armatimonadia bacterium]
MSAIRPPLWDKLQPQDLMSALANPPDRYRPVPWLAWTGDLHWEGLRAQLDDMRAKGLTEFFLFPIYGMEMPYMSLAYWERVKQTLEHCRATGMKCWIYDEYNWPSGICGGTVIRDHPEAREHLLWLRDEADSAEAPGLPPKVTQTSHTGGAEWATAEGQAGRTSARYGDWVTNMTGYLDMMSAEACERFLDSTHRKYLAHAPEMFPETIPGFFTDEPGFTNSRMVKGWLSFPYTHDLFEDFQRRYGYDLRDRLGDLLADTPTAPQTRCHYWRLVAERYSEGYAGTIRRWCDEQGVAFTGHCLGEEALALHVRMEGDLWEAMKHYTIPGIDMLANADGFTYPESMTFYGQVDRRAFHLTCKYVHSICRHNGSREMMSEAYGVCDWGMNLLRQKRGFHYQVALGVTLFNDNSLVTSIADFRKYAIAGKHFTQPWWQHYKLYADYNARLAALHAEGEPVAEVAVLYPRSALWAQSDARMVGKGWLDLSTGHPLAGLQQQIYELLDELIREQWSFDFIFEPVLAEARVEGDELITEHCRYRTLVVPSAKWLPARCLQVLQQFAAAGGRVIFSGALPENEADSLDSLGEEVGRLLAEANVVQVGGTGAEVRSALAAHSQPPLALEGEGRREFVSSWREIAGSDVLFLANMAEQETEVTIHTTLDGPLAIVDPFSLQAFRPAVEAGGFRWRFAPWQAYLLVTGPAAVALGEDLPAQPVWQQATNVGELDGEWDFDLLPGNMLRLAVQARPDPRNAGAAEGWQHDTGEAGWITPEDDRLPEAIRPGDAPWYWLRTTVKCEAGAHPKRIVVDNPSFLELFVNGRPAQQVAGTPLWTEENLHYDVEGLLHEGDNTIHIRVLTSKYNDARMAPLGGTLERILQPVVLLGDFRLEGQTLLAPVPQVRVDQPWEAQGMPHVAGVGVYRRHFTAPTQQQVWLRLPDTVDAVEVLVNGQPAGQTAWPPYVFDLAGLLREGDNELEIRVSNTLGNIILGTYAGAKPPVYPSSGLQATPQLLFM